MNLEILTPVTNSPSDNIISLGESKNFGEPHILFNRIRNGNYMDEGLNLIEKENYLGYVFDNNVVLYSYTIFPWFYGRNLGQVNCPNSWIFEVTPDFGHTWVKIAEEKGHPIQWPSYKSFFLEEPVVCTGARLRDVQAYGSPGFYEIDFIGVHKKISILFLLNNYYSFIDNEWQQVGTTEDDLKELFTNYGMDDISDIDKDKLSWFTEPVKIVTYIEK